MRFTRYMRRICGLLLCGAACCQVPAYADAVLDVGDPRPEGEFVVIPIEFTPDAETATAGLQLDLEFDTSRFEVDSVVAGYAATEGGKGVMWSQLDSGRIRVLVAGVNQSALPEGAVASLYLTPLSTTYDANPCSLDAGICSGPFGDEVPVLLPSNVNEGVDDSPAKTEASFSQSDLEPGVVQREDGSNAEPQAGRASASPQPATAEGAGPTAGSTSLGGGVADAADERFDQARAPGGRSNVTGRGLDGPTSSYREESGRLRRFGLPARPSGVSRDGNNPYRRPATAQTLPGTPSGERLPASDGPSEPPHRVLVARAEEPEALLGNPQRSSVSGRDEKRPQTAVAATSQGGLSAAKRIAAIAGVGAAMLVLLMLRRRWLEPRGAGR